MSFLDNSFTKIGSLKILTSHISPKSVQTRRLAPESPSHSTLSHGVSIACDKSGIISCTTIPSFCLAFSILVPLRKTTVLFSPKVVATWVALQSRLHQRQHPRESPSHDTCSPGGPWPCRCCRSCPALSILLRSVLIVEYSLSRMGIR